MRLILARCPVLVVAIILVLPLPTLSAEFSGSFGLMSSAFQNGSTIPQRYTCAGFNKSPALVWTGVPSRTRSLAVIVSDPDAPGGNFVHWVVYNISPAEKELPEAVSASASAAKGDQGVNGRAELGYTGPCPPPGGAHHYHFRMYALDQKLGLKPGATAEQLEAAMKGHVLGATELVGIFGR